MKTPYANAPDLTSLKVPRSAVPTGHARRDGRDGPARAVTPYSRSFEPPPQDETWWVRHAVWFDLGTAAAIIALATVVALHFRALG